MEDYKHIRITEPAYANYTGELGIVIFKDGLSVEKWPPHVRNRLAAAMRVAEVNEDGSELAAGGAEEMLRNRLTEAEVAKPLHVQTHAEKLAELIEAATGEKQPAPLYTMEQLEEIAREKKRQGLIEIANKWRVRATNIPSLIAGILDAQAKFKDRTEGKAQLVRARYEEENGEALRKEAEALAKNSQAKLSGDSATSEPKTQAADGEKSKKRGRPARQAPDKVAKVPDAEPVGFTPKLPVSNEVKLAAANGDMSAALNSGE